jgi:hypothetical protein
MVLVYLPTKLGDDFGVNVGTYSMEHQGKDLDSKLMNPRFGMVWDGLDLNMVTWFRHVPATWNPRIWTHTQYTIYCHLRLKRRLAQVCSGLFYAVKRSQASVSQPGIV